LGCRGRPCDGAPTTGHRRRSAAESAGRAIILAVERPPGCPEGLSVFTAAERPDLWEQVRSRNLFRDLWPEYNNHGNNTPAYFGTLFGRFPEYQTLFVEDSTSRVVARGRTIPFRWDGSLVDLPQGIDDLGLRAVGQEGPPNALSALAAEVDRSVQRTGLSRIVIASMVAVARVQGLGPLVAPVRPNHKDRYPLTPIERYATWRREDGLPFDPWMRVHVRMGATILRAEPCSMHIVAPVEDWESWTGTAFPEDGLYVFPQGLAPLTVSGGEGDYWEPNVWMQHDTALDPASPLDATR
jgi:hypothetical protein